MFVGPYEHHSNEVTWRQGLATVVEVNLAADGGIDLAHLESLLQAPEYQGRLRIGSFSAASNVTGMRSPVREIAKLLHANDAFACFDYAASAPYVEIDMNPPLDDDGGDASLDAVFLSPHKFLGGPGSSGVLVFNERLYSKGLGPSVAGGGTVDYVSPHDQDFIADIEEREKAGTPGVLQTLKAALVLELKQRIGVARIEAREHELLRRALRRWSAHDGIEVLGNPDPSRRIGIVSFNLRDARGRYLHPKFVTVLLNDLFGIQSRAGCSCAGPYGHRLLGIDQPTSELYRDWVRKGFQGIKPGWCRVGFHYAMDDAEADYRHRGRRVRRRPRLSIPAALFVRCEHRPLVAIVNTRSSTKRFRSMRPWPRVLRVARRCRWKRGARCISDAWRKRGPGRAGWASQRCRPRRWSWRRRSASYSFSTSASPALHGSASPHPATVRNAHRYVDSMHRFSRSGP